jgi:hypothetical protein
MALTKKTKETLEIALADKVAAAEIASIYSSLGRVNVRYVSKGGSDKTGDGSASAPFLTIEAAEASIADASNTNFYCIDIAPGTYAIAAGFTKKPNIGWRGAGRRLTSVSVGALSAVGGVSITNAIDQPTAQLFFENLTINGGPTGFTFNQTVGATSNNIIVNMANVRIATGTSIVFNGTSTGSQITLFNCEVIGTTTIKTAYLYAVVCYFGGRITADANTLLDEAPFTLTADTVQGSSIVKFPSAVSNSFPAGTSFRVSGAGIPDGSVTFGSGGTFVAGVWQVQLNQNATATQTGITLTVYVRRDSLIQVYSSTAAGFTIKKFATCTLGGVYNQSNLIINDSGTTVSCTSDVVRSSTSITQDAGTILTRASDAFGMGYTPAVSANWNGTAPVSVAEALDRLAVVVKALNGGTGA